MIRAVIFDFNGVLVDDEMVHFALFRDVLAELGIELSEARYHAEYLGYDDRGCFEAALGEAGRPADRATIDALIARKADRYIQAAETGLRIFPGASEAIAALAERWPLAICSGALRGEVEFALGRMGVRDRVVALVAAEDTSRCKPDPEGYRNAFAGLATLSILTGLEPRECLVIEDSLAGIAAALAAGMIVVGVAQTYSMDELTRAGAHAVLPDVASVTPEWVGRAFSDSDPIEVP